MPLNSEISNASESLISAEAVDEVIRSSYCTERLSQSSHGSAAAIPLPVAIIGGGLGGSALAISLQRRRIPVVVFEKDSSFAARRYIGRRLQAAPALYMWPYALRSSLRNRDMMPVRVERQ